MLQMQVLNPWWLLALLALPLTLLLERNSFAALGAWQRRAATVLRFGLLILLTLALAGFQTRDPNRPMQVVYLLDRSLSVTPSEFQNGLAYVQEAVKNVPPKRKEQTESALLVFGRNASFEQGFKQELKVEAIQSVVAEDYTDIARALELAAATFNPGAEKRIVLLTDGRENVGSAEQVARRLRQQGVTVDAVAIGSELADEVMARKVIVPSRADQRETFAVKCVVDSTVAKEAVLKLYRNGTFWGEQDVTLTEGRNVFSFNQTESSKGFYTYSFEIATPGDAESHNNSARNFTFVEGQPRILYLTGDPNEGPDLAQMLAPKQIQMEFHQAAFMPHDLADLLAYDAVFFSDVSAETLLPGQQDLIQGYVQALGKGFVMLGGEQSFGVGGWYHSVVEEVLPVTMDFKRQQHFPSTALGLIIDRSGSMSEMSGGYTKLDLAKKSALECGTLLTQRDYIGVMQFDTLGSWVTNGYQKNLSKSRLRAQVGSISLGGGTNIYAGLRPAVDDIIKCPAQVKHIILLSDGMTAPGDWDGILRDCNRAGVTITCVATGADSNEPFLRELAEKGGGRYYPLLDARNLPRIFTKETFLAATRSVIEEPFYATQAEHHPITEGFPFGASKPLLGYNATTKKDAATVSMTAPSGDPLLAHWNYGLGKSVAWTSDTKRRWAAAWMGWGPAQGMWTQGIRWLVGEQDSKELVAQISREGSRSTISVDSFTTTGELDAGGKVTAYIWTPDHQTREIALRQVAPGRFELDEEFPDVGNYLVNIVREQEGQVTGVVRTGFAVSYSPEYEGGPPNTYLLTRVSETTLGLLDPAPAAVYRPVDGTVEGIAWKDWTQPFLMWVILLFPLDIAVRRILMPEEGLEVWFEAIAAGFVGLLRPMEHAAAQQRERRVTQNAARWAANAEQRVRQEEKRGPSAKPPTEGPSVPRTGATPTTGGSGDLQRRVENILSGPGKGQRGEDDTYQALLRAKRRVRGEAEDE